MANLYFVKEAVRYANASLLTRACVHLFGRREYIVDGDEEMVLMATWRGKRYFLGRTRDLAARGQ